METASLSQFSSCFLFTLICSFVPSVTQPSPLLFLYITLHLLGLDLFRQTITVHQLPVATIVADTSPPSSRSVSPQPDDWQQSDISAADLSSWESERFQAHFGMSVLKEQVFLNGLRITSLIDSSECGTTAATLISKFDAAIRSSRSTRRSFALTLMCLLRHATIVHSRQVPHILVS